MPEAGAPYNMYLEYIFKDPSMSAPFANSAAGGALPRLAFEITAQLRADGHLCNVLTHVSSGDWRAVEQAMIAVLKPRARPETLSKLAGNLLELLCDDRGVAGRAMRPFVFQAIGRITGSAEMTRHEARVRRLRRRMSVESHAGLAAAAAPAPIRAPAARRIPVHPLSSIAAQPRPANGVHP